LSGSAVTASRVRLTAALLLASLAASPAWAKTARCVIKDEGGVYSGPCTFLPLGGGSFSVHPVGRKDFFAHTKDLPGTTDVSVQVLGSGSADVRGLNTFGINARWGDATRSAKDRACWVGEDFSVCVY
jgi:hypothetical protein